jgi:integrase
MAKRRKRGVRGAGTIIQTGNATWGLKYVNADGKRVTRAGLTELEAQTAQARLKKGMSPFPEDATEATSETKSRTIADVLPAFWNWRDGRGLKSVRDDRNRWVHLAALEPLPLEAVDDVAIAGVVKAMQKAKLAPATIGLVLNLLSSLFKFAKVANPVRGYKIDHRKVIKSKHDPKDTPFLADHAKSKALRDELATHAPVYGIAYALSRWAGLRPGEVRAQEWVDVDLVKAQIKVRASVRLGKKDTTKSDKPRTVPIGAELVATLKSWREKNPEAVLVCPALPPKAAKATKSKACSTKPRNWSPYLNEGKLNTALEAALNKLNLPTMTFYEVGRHSFASDWAIQGRSIYQLRDLMGHASVTTTERYAHLGQNSIAPL